MKLCAPAIIYLIFSITQILIDLYKGQTNTAGIKVIVTAMVTLLLNILCQRELTFVSWIIVFIPFILMTTLVSILLYMFGLDVATGSLDVSCETQTPDGVKIDEKGNVVIYDPEYDGVRQPVYYRSPYIIVPNPRANDVVLDDTNTTTVIVPKGSSSPAYVS